MHLSAERSSSLFSDLPEESVYSYPSAALASVGGAPLALGEGTHSERAPTALYVHVPFCLSLCQFCGFVTSSDVRPHLVSRWLDSTLRELHLVTELLAVARPVHAVYFGGGTASTLSPAQIESILTAIHRLFRVASDAELTFEGECLTLLKKNYLRHIASLGFRRVSFGVQTLDRGARAVLNLRPSEAALIQLTQAAAGLFDDVCVDFIYGWPGQTADHLVDDVSRTLQELAPPSIEIFQFEKLDASPLFLRSLYAAGVPDLSTSAVQELRRCAVEALTERGYGERSYSSYSRAPYRAPTTYTDCFYGYDNGNVIGVGRGAQSFCDGRMWAFGFAPQPHDEYVARGILPASLYADYGACEREAVMWPKRGWVSRDVVDAFADADYAERLGALVSHGYVSATSDCYRVTADGRAWTPSLIYHLMPRTQRDRFEAITRSRLEARMPITRSCA